MRIRAAAAAAVLSVAVAAPSALAAPAADPVPAPQPTTSDAPTAVGDATGDGADDASGDAGEQAGDASQAASAREEARALQAARAEFAAARKNLRRVAAVHAVNRADAQRAGDILAAAERKSRRTRAAMQRARQDFGNLARMTYGSVPSDLAEIAALLDADSANDLLRRAATLESVSERQLDQWRETVAARARAERVEARLRARFETAQARATRSKAIVSIAQDRLDRAAAAVSQGRGRLIGMAGAVAGAGVRELAERCADHLSLWQCVPSGWAEEMMTLDAVWIMRTVRTGWPDIEDVGGYRPSDPYPDHPSGRAVDVMIPDYGNADGIALGDEIARYFMAHAERYGVTYIIWRQRIWRLGGDAVAPPAKWRSMGDRGGDTANHLDHVHISLSTGTAGTAIDEMLRLGAGGPPSPFGD